MGDEIAIDAPQQFGAVGAATRPAPPVVVVAHGNAGTWRLVKEERPAGQGIVFHIELAAEPAVAGEISWQRVPMAEMGVPYEDMLRTFVAAWIRQHRLAERFELA